MLAINYLKYILASILILNLCVANTQEVLLTLKHGEELLYEESYLTLFDSKYGLQVCTIDQEGRYYVYINNQRKGPFLKLQDATDLINYTGYDSNSGNDPKNQAYNEKLITMDDEGNVYITINRKRFGPYRSVQDLYVAANGIDYMAVVSKVDNMYKYPPDYLLISSSQPEIPLRGEPYELKVNQSVKNGVIATRVENSENTDMEEVYKQLERIAELAELMEAEEITLQQYINEISTIGSQAESNSHEYYVYADNNLVFGPYSINYFSSQVPGYGVNSGDRWHMVAGGKLYISGKPVSDSDDFILDFYWSKTGNNYAYRTYNSIIFSSGQSYPYPVEIKAVEENGKTVLKWLTFEDESRFVLYQKAL
jgi:hypothetical protein